MRPEMGAVIEVYFRLMRAVSTVAFPILYIRLSLFQRGSRIIVVLLADRFIGQQFPQAISLQLDCRQIGLGPGKRGLGIVERRLIKGRINLKERLAGLDIGAFRKQALLDDTD